jgi:hypothetical protein
MESGERPLNGLAFCEYVDALGADAAENDAGGGRFWDSGASAFDR